MGQTNVLIERLYAPSKIRKNSLHVNDLTRRVIFNRDRSMLAKWTEISVTRLGDLLDFGPLFKAFGSS